MPREDSVMSNNLKNALVIIVALIAIESVGFHTIEGWGLLESVYMTVMTLTTVGYGDFAPQSRTGMIFTVLLVSFGVGTMLYTVGLVPRPWWKAV
jgi:voltage-gated potassium channel Kch